MGASLDLDKVDRAGTTPKTAAMTMKAPVQRMLAMSRAQEVILS